MSKFIKYMMSKKDEQKAGSSRGKPKEDRKPQK